MAFGSAPSASCDRSLLVLTPEYAPYTWGGLGTYLHHALPLVAVSGLEVDVVVSPTYAAKFTDVGHEVPQIEALCMIDSRLGRARPVVVEKVRNIVGLYLDPSERVLALMAL